MHAPCILIINCIQLFNTATAINRLGPPTDVNTAIEEKSLTLSWQPPLMLSSDTNCYKISVNVTGSRDPQNILTQFVSNCTYNTTYTLSLSSIGINRCNGDYFVEVSVAGVSFAQVEGDFARITETISSIQNCSVTGKLCYIIIFIIPFLTLE